MSTSSPLDLEEIVALIRNRWGVTYDLQLIARGKTLYLQLMWGYLEQQSFPLTEDEFKNHLSQIIEVLNRLGQEELVRDWLRCLKGRPRLGRAITLQLKVDASLNEFLI